MFFKMFLNRRQMAAMKTRLLDEIKNIPSRIAAKGDESILKDPIVIRGFVSIIRDIESAKSVKDLEAIECSLAEYISAVTVASAKAETATDSETKDAEEAKADDPLRFDIEQLLVPPEGSMRSTDFSFLAETRDSEEREKYVKDEARRREIAHESDLNGIQGVDWHYYFDHIASAPRRARDDYRRDMNRALLSAGVLCDFKSGAFGVMIGGMNYNAEISIGNRYYFSNRDYAEAFFRAAAKLKIAIAYRDFIYQIV